MVSSVRVDVNSIRPIEVHEVQLQVSLQVVVFISTWILHTSTRRPYSTIYSIVYDATSNATRATKAQYSQE